MGLLSRRPSSSEKAARRIRQGRALIIPSAEGVRYYGSALPSPGSGNTVKPTEQVIQLTHRNPGCEAKLEDDSIDQNIPVCMGGLAISGCNNPEQCGKSYVERKNDTSSSYIFHVQENTGIVEFVTALPNEFSATD